MEKEIKTGDPFFLDGKDYQIIEPPKPELVLFINKDNTKQVVCLRKEVIWNNNLKAWTLPGRLLSQVQKDKFASKEVKMSWGTSPGSGMMGSLPRAEDHEEILKKFNNKEL